MHLLLLSLALLSFSAAFAGDKECPQPRQLKDFSFKWSCDASTKRITFKKIRINEYGDKFELASDSEYDKREHNEYRGRRNAEAFCMAHGLFMYSYEVNDTWFSQDVADIRLDEEITPAFNGYGQEVGTRYKLNSLNLYSGNFENGYHVVDKIVCVSINLN